MEPENELTVRLRGAVRLGEQGKLVGEYSAFYSTFST